MATDTQEGGDGGASMLQRLVPPEEELIGLRRSTTLLSGYRWFRSPNVVCIEHYREKRKVELHVGV